MQRKAEYFDKSPSRVAGAAYSSYVFQSASHLLERERASPSVCWSGPRLPASVGAEICCGCGVWMPYEITKLSAYVQRRALHVP